MEKWDLYDYDRNKIGKTHTRGEPLPEGCYHIVVHVWIQNDRGKLLLSKRHPNKHYGNLWECTGGSVLTGETSLEGALRETKEELGIELNPESGQLLFSEVRSNHHSDNWLFISNAKLNDLEFQPDEVIDAKWVSKDTYEKMIQKGEIVPTLQNFFSLLSRS
ncbi:NUDIX domain-containing protein [Virgibacillus dakarensis]|uniref:NUDIX hydrolase n=1 Tax=Lentibacillus populi TaxID=1827502 RepID=A0A9W5X736_9BACI|nr:MULTISPECIES: NUDIX domain-containing protein [Bacillaceae]MBT2217007.1 NUDIX domain-containing protein [Virgibacillus dakarensis]MTW86928.1 NUDIX domain-containing protein [Virgibacillus dakarensis]GGB52551.1 NUDIX hydrolase [Lentibacillus populi]